MGDRVERTQPRLTLEPVQPGHCLPVPPSLPSRAEGLTPPPGSPAAAWPHGGRDAGRPCQGSLTTRPSLGSGCRRSQRSCRHKTSLFPRASLRLPPSLPPRGGRPRCWGAREAPGVRVKAVPGWDPCGTGLLASCGDGQPKSNPLDGSISQAVWARGAWPAPLLPGLPPRGRCCSHRPLTVPWAPAEPKFLSTIRRGGSAALTAPPAQQRASDPFPSEEETLNT